MYYNLGINIVMDNVKILQTVDNDFLNLHFLIILKFYASFKKFLIFGI